MVPGWPPLQGNAEAENDLGFLYDYGGGEFLLIIKKRRAGIAKPLSRATLRRRST